MAGQRQGRDRSQVMLYTVAGLLAAVGLGFLLAAYVSFQNDDSPVPLSRPVATATDTAVSNVEGARSTETPEAVATQVATAEEQATVAPTAADTETPAPAATSEPTATEVPAATEIPVATSAPLEPTPEPTEEPVLDPTEPLTTEPTPTPPAVIISGPTTVAVGEQAHYSVAIDPKRLTAIWRFSGQEKLHVLDVDVSWPSEGCSFIQLEEIYLDGSRKTTTMSVAVGSGVCP